MKESQKSNKRKAPEKRERFFQYGNYSSYYNYRNENLEDDTRLKFMKREWFTFRDVLDIGCNAGDITMYIAQKFGANSVLGVDIDASLVERAKSRIAKIKPLNPFPPHFPISFTQIPRFPSNLSFKTFNILESNIEQTFGMITCLSTTKWIHLNFGDEGVKKLFKFVYDHLYEEGYFLLEPQHWPSYKKKHNIFPVIKENYAKIQFKPDQFPEYLKEIGFELVEEKWIKDTEGKVTKNFNRPIYLFKKASKSGSSTLNMEEDGSDDEE
eukprot:TRINITY_DN8418_c0_g1_i1.p1 TRINITY_DN8418_c0_g1~~TRINITY_DN8418_c0_g1_i1.p1  ORF type:complete len:307 (-),score=101.53 TRINITY_DN8418_c0_g1_i1:117-920(-)